MDVIHIDDPPPKAKDKVLTKGFWDNYPGARRMPPDVMGKLSVKLEVLAEHVFLELPKLHEDVARFILYRTDEGDPASDIQHAADNEDICYSRKDMMPRTLYDYNMRVSAGGIAALANSKLLIGFCIG